MTKISGDASERDVRELIDMLWLRDSAAGARSEWRAVADDFEEESFVGYVGGPGNAAWRIAFPDLASYAKVWVEGTEKLRGDLDPVDYERQIIAASSIGEVEVNGDWALVRKDFYGTVGQEDSLLNSRTYYFLRRVGGRWRIVGFAAGLENDLKSASSEKKLTKHLPENAEVPSGPYSPVLVVPAGDLVVISGQGPLDQHGRVAGSSIGEQADLTLEHCRRQLELAGADFRGVFKVNVYLANLDEWAEFNEVYRRMMPEPLPVRTTIGAALLLGILVEVDMWAVATNPRQSG